VYLRSSGEGTLFPKDSCVVSYDGTHIAYALRGKQREPVVVLCAGFCCPDNFWKYLAPVLEKRYRVLIWNYRGAGMSGLPREPGYRARNFTPDDFTIDKYARDLVEILEHERINEVVLIGHSMGVQVCLESYRLLRERVRAIVSVTGPYASAMHTLYNTKIFPRIFPIGRTLINLFPQPLRFSWHALFHSSLPHPGAVAIRALGPDTKLEDMRPYYDHMGNLDPLVILKMAEGMHLHSAEDLLREINAPTLVIVGDRDNFTPPWLGRVMASRIPVAELVVVPGGTHGTIIEKPKLVNRSVLEFLGRHVRKGASGPVSLTERRNRENKAKTSR
jgi:pimeloyl-ACP methyl ester carboxylesterase